MKNKRTKIRGRNGITLVALVVTIVVLLIMAGISINMVLGNNGIINKAQESKTKSAEASQNDLTAMDELAQELESTLNGSSNGKSDTEENELGKLVSYMGTLPTDTTPYFPSSDFKRREKTNTSNGLVIEDGEGNQYVWVVVPRTKEVYGTTDLGKTTFTEADYESIETDLKNYTNTYRKGTQYTDTWADDTSSEGWFSEGDYNTAKQNMLKSVYVNGGFYVGRYEAGIADFRMKKEAKVNGKNPVPTTAPVIKPDAYPYTNVTRTQAQKLAESFNYENGEKTYKGSLLFGIQWDLVLAFMAQDSKITNESDLIKQSGTIGNYINGVFDLNRGKYAQYGELGNEWKNFNEELSSIVVSNTETGKMKKTWQGSYNNGIILTTGATEHSKVMNIYDIAGNVSEYTIEKATSSTPVVIRGGYYGKDGSNAPAAIRNEDYVGNYYDYVGFRVSLW